MRIWMLICLLFACPVHAAEVPVALRNWLQALDSAPTPAQVQRAGGSRTVDLLDQVVRDGHEVLFVRSRAIGLLSLLDDAPAETRMRKLLTLRDDNLRATAALAWLAGPARRHPSGTASTLALLLADPSAAVRSATARGLGYCADRPQTRALAVQRRARESDPVVRAALDAAIRKLDEQSARR